MSSCTCAAKPFVYEIPDLLHVHCFTKHLPGQAEVAAHRVVMSHEVHVHKQAARPLDAPCTSSDTGGVLTTNGSGWSPQATLPSLNSAAAQSSKPIADTSNSALPVFPPSPVSSVSAVSPKSPGKRPSTKAAKDAAHSFLKRASDINLYSDVFAASTLTDLTSSIAMLGACQAQHNTDQIWQCFQQILMLHACMQTPLHAPFIMQSHIVQK